MDTIILILAVIAIVIFVYLFMQWKRKWDRKNKIRTYQETIKENANDTESYYLWGLMLLENHEWEEANEKLAKVISIDPKHVDARNCYAGTLLNLNKAEEAIAQYKAIIEIDPTYEIAYYNWDILLPKLKNTETYTTNKQQIEELLTANKQLFQLDKDTYFAQAYKRHFAK